MLADPTLVTLALVGMLTLIPGAALYTGTPVRSTLVALAVLVPLWAAIGVVGALLGLLAEFAVLLPAAGVVFGVLAERMLAERISAPRALVSVAVFSVLVVLPALVMIFGVCAEWAYEHVGALDFAGALAFGVALGVLVLVHRRRGRGRASARPRALWGALLCWVGATAFTVGVELRVDALTGPISLCMAVIGTSAAVGAVVVEFLRRGRVSAQGCAAGVLAGAFAGLAVSPWVELVPAIIIGVATGVVQGGVFRAGERGWASAPLLVGGLAGVLSLGLFAIGPGFVYSGQPTQFVAQLIACAVVMAGSVVVAGVVAVATRPMPVRSGVRARPERTR